MALNDSAVLTAAVGYVFTGPVGTAAPTPSELTTLDPATYGAFVKTVKLTGSPTGGTFTITVGAATTSAIAYNATTSQVQSALEALVSVGAGNVVVSGTLLTDASGFDIAFVGSLQGTSPTVSATGSLTGGTTPAAVASTKTTTNGWTNIGHTSRDDMPEFGFDGGDTQVKGTWQKKRLREVATGDPVADSVTIKLSQWDNTSLALYYGADASATAGVFGVSGDFTPQEKALLIVIVDGTVRLGFHSPKSSIKRDDSVQLPVDEFATLPIKATFLNLGTNLLYSWISETLFA
jgi:hypothetical protein